MAYWKIGNVSLRGVSACVPKNILNTYDINLFTKEEAEIFINNVGILNRHVVTKETCASDLCFRAAEKLIEDLGWERDSIDVLLFVSLTADYRNPPTSCILQDRLGLKNDCFTLDISMGCCGFIHGTTVISNLLSSGCVKRGLLLVGDTVTRMSSPFDKSRMPLFGDCGTASAWEYNPDKAGCITIQSSTDGANYQAIMTPHSGFRHQVTPESFIYEDFGAGIKRAPVHALLDGLEVFSFAITKVPVSIKNLLNFCSLDKDKDVDYYLFHQANKMINDKIIKKLKIDTSKVVSNIKEFGNCSGASLPLLMVTGLRHELQNRTLSLILSAFGVGLAWGGVNITTDHLVIPELIELEEND